MRASISRAWVAALALLLGCGRVEGTDVGSTSEGLEQCSATTFGVDVSDGQGTINWSSVRGAGVRFAFMKATQGTYNTQWTFAHNWSGAKAAGITRIPYHFFDPTQDGVAQADHFLSVVGPLSTGDPAPMLDIECPDGDPSCLGWSGASGWEPGSTIRQRMLDFLNTVQSRTGKTPIIYTFGSYWSGAGVSTTGLQSYPLFLADLSSGPGCVYVPSPWTHTTFRQYSWHGSVAGIPTEVDLDAFQGTYSQLQAFAGVPQTCGGTPTALPLPTQAGELASGQGLARGQSLRSADGRFTLSMQGDGNLVLYSFGVPLWASNTVGQGYVASMQGDGNLVVYSSTSCPVWSSGTYGHSGSSLHLQDDGNLVVYDPSYHPLWASNTGRIPKSPAGCDVVYANYGLAPNQAFSSCNGTYRLSMQGDGNLVLYHNGVGPIWASNTVGKPFRWLAMQGDGNLVMYTEQRPIWATNTWGKTGAELHVQNDGNLVIYQYGHPIWASGTAGR